MPFVNARDMVTAAQRGHWAVGHFNLNNMEFLRAFLAAAEEVRSPIILALSAGPANYMGGYATVAGMVKGFMDHMHITVPVCLHADHGTYEEALAAIEGGFSSVMFDGSKCTFEENLVKTRHIVEVAHAKGITVEAEVGAVGGVEDGRVGMGECADPVECRRIMELGIDCLAAGIGNIHGKYPANWPGLRFDVLAAIQKETGDLPLVLHGGSGIPEDMVRQAISLGVSKVNVNTECQIAFAEATRRFIEEGQDKIGTNYALQPLLAPGMEAVKQKCIEKMTLFGSVGKA